MFTITDRKIVPVFVVANDQRIDVLLDNESKEKRDMHLQRRDKDKNRDKDLHLQIYKDLQRINSIQICWCE